LWSPKLCEKTNRCAVKAHTNSPFSASQSFHSSGTSNNMVRRVVLRSTVYVKFVVSLFLFFWCSMWVPWCWCFLYGSFWWQFDGKRLLNIGWGHARCHASDLWTEAQRWQTSANSWKGHGCRRQWHPRRHGKWRRGSLEGWGENPGRMEFTLW
jgi:hypothetical protein